MNHELASRRKQKACVECMIFQQFSGIAGSLTFWKAVVWEEIHGDFFNSYLNNPKFYRWLKLTVSYCLDVKLTNARKYL